MNKLTIFQTLENRENADEIENHGPYMCTRSDAWLGDGYYFWDTFIGHAHSWGKKAYSNKYFICQADFVSNPEQLFDLVGNMQHLNILKEASRMTKEFDRPCTVAGTIEYLKRKTDFSSDFIAIRARDEYSPNSKNLLPFTSGSKEYLNITPRVQLCVFQNVSSVVFNFRVIYPEEYISEPLFTTI